MIKKIWSSPFVRYTRQTPLFQLGLAITLFWLLVAFFAPYIAPYNPLEIHADAILSPPNRLHWFGTDSYGFDIFSRVLYAPRIDLGIAIVSSTIASFVGVIVGAVGGYFLGSKGLPGMFSQFVMRAVDVMQAFPVFIFALALVAALGRSTTNVIIAMVFVNTPVFIWLTRSEILNVKQKSYIEAARCSGNSEMRIALLHVLPNSLAPALTQISVIMGTAVLLTAGLSFVGAGVRIPTPEWGLMISMGSKMMITGQWWVAMFPGLALASAVFGFSLVGDGLRNYIDPQRRVDKLSKKTVKKSNKPLTPKAQEI